MKIVSDKSWITLVLADIMDWDTIIGPTHMIIGLPNMKKLDLIPVYIGKCDEYVGYIGIYVTGEDYDKINHMYCPILIHDPGANKETIQDFMHIIESNIHENTNPYGIDCEHMHIILSDTHTPTTVTIH